MFLTSKGEAKLHQSMRVQIEVVQAMTGVLSESEIETNLDIMTRVYESLNNL